MTYIDQYVHRFRNKDGSQHYSSPLFVHFISSVVVNICLYSNIHTLAQRKNIGLVYIIPHLLYMLMISSKGWRWTKWTSQATSHHACSDMAIVLAREIIKFFFKACRVSLASWGTYFHRNRTSPSCFNNASGRVKWIKSFRQSYGGHNSADTAYRLHVAAIIVKRTK